MKEATKNTSHFWRPKCQLLCFQNLFELMQKCRGGLPVAFWGAELFTNSTAQCWPWPPEHRDLQGGHLPMLQIDRPSWGEETWRSDVVRWDQSFSLRIAVFCSWWICPSNGKVVSSRCLRKAAPAMTSSHWPYGLSVCNRQGGPSSSRPHTEIPKRSKKLVHQADTNSQIGIAWYRASMCLCNTLYVSLCFCVQELHMACLRILGKNEHASKFRVRSVLGVFFRCVGSEACRCLMASEKEEPVLMGGQCLQWWGAMWVMPG